MNISKEQIEKVSREDIERALIEQAAIEQAVESAKARTKALSKLLIGSVPEEFLLTYVEDEMRYVAANLPPLMQMTNGRASLTLCTDITKPELAPTDLNVVVEQIIKQDPHVVLMDYGMKLSDGNKQLKTIDQNHDDDFYFHGTDIVRALRENNHKGLIFGFSSSIKHHDSFTLAGTDANILKCEKPDDVFASMKEIAAKIKELYNH